MAIADRVLVARISLSEISQVSSESQIAENVQHCLRRLATARRSVLECGLSQLMSGSLFFHFFDGDQRRRLPIRDARFL